MVRSVPVVVEKLPAEYVLEAIEPSEVEVTLSGLRRGLFFRSGEDTALHIDALLVKLGRRTFQVTPELVRAPAGLEAVSVQPSQVRLSVRSSDGAATPSP
jgi:hypothetical protein